MGEPATKNVEEQGESFSPELTFTWINPGTIDAGEQIIPALLSSADAKSFAAHHLVLRDLEFATECLNQAKAFGIPDDRNLQSRALIFTGIVGYARCFKTGVRERLNPEDIAKKGTPFDVEIHEYMLALRDKHITHSVNDFEDCLAVAIVVGTPGTGWRDGSAVGVVIKQTVGITANLLLRAITHIERLKEFIAVELEVKRIAVYEEFRQAFAQDGKWEAAPLVKMSDHSKISKRRT